MNLSKTFARAGVIALMAGSILGGTVSTAHAATPSPDAPTAQPNTTLSLRIMNKAATQNGKKYVWGAKGPKTFDCSGLLWWAYVQVTGRSNFGVGTSTQLNSSAIVARSPFVSYRQVPKYARKGDLVYMYDKNKQDTHVGIYVSSTYILNASQSQGRVTYLPLSYFANPSRHISFYRVYSWR